MDPENKIVDSLSQYLTGSSKYCDKFGQTISDEELNNINSSADSSENEILYDEGDTLTKIDINDILVAQNGGKRIRYIKEIIANSDDSSMADRGKPPAEYRILLKD